MALKPKLISPISSGRPSISSTRAPQGSPTANPAATFQAKPTSLCAVSGHSTSRRGTPLMGARVAASPLHHPSRTTTPMAADVPAPLPGIEDVPEDLQPLFLEMQQFGMNSSVKLKGIGPQALRALYERASKRLDSLPNTLCSTSMGEVVQVPLPGKRGVKGWRVDTTGSVSRATLLSFRFSLLRSLTPLPNLSLSGGPY